MRFFGLLLLIAVLCNLCAAQVRPQDIPRPVAPQVGPQDIPRPVALQVGPQDIPRPVAPQGGPQDIPRPVASQVGPQDIPRPVAPQVGPQDIPRSVAPSILPIPLRLQLPPLTMTPLPPTGLPPITQRPPRPFPILRDDLLINKCLQLCEGGYDPLCNRRGSQCPDLCPCQKPTIITPPTMRTRLPLPVLLPNYGPKLCRMVCSMDYQPVCAGNGQTFSNVCQLDDHNCQNSQNALEVICNDSCENCLKTSGREIFVVAE